MANRYWVGGNGTWNTTNTTNWSATSGGAGGASVPTTADDVFIDAGSDVGLNFNITVPTSTTISCRNFTVGGAGGLPDFPILWNFATSNSLWNCAGSVDTGGPGNNFSKTGTGAIAFLATSTGQTLNLFNINSGWSQINWNGTGGGWTCQTSLSAADFILTRGSLNTNGQTMTQTSSTGTFNISGTNARSLSLGSSSINLAAITGNAWNAATTTNLTFDAGTSTITLQGSNSNPSFQGGGLTYYNVVLITANNGEQTIAGTNTFNTLTFNSPSTTGVAVVRLSNNQVVTGAVVAAGATVIRRIYFRSNTAGTPRTITTAAWTSPANLDFRDITVAGAVGTLSGTSFGNCGGNSGITFPASKTVYWNLAGSQSYSATAWALNSGGSPSLNNFPLVQDTAVFDNLGAGSSVIFNATWNVGTVDFSARTTALTVTMNSDIEVYGNILDGTGLTYSNTGDYLFVGTGIQNYTPAGVAFTGALRMQGLGTLNLLGTTLVTGSSTGGISINSGTFNTNNNTVTTPAFASNTSTARTINLGTSIINLTATGTVWAFTTSTNLTFNGSSSTINTVNDTTTARVLNLGSTLLTYGTINLGGSGSSTTEIDSAGATITIGSLTSTKTVAHTVLFGNNYIINNWGVTGSVGAVVTVGTDSAGTTRTITYGGSRVNLSYMSFDSVNFAYALGPTDPYLIYASNSTNLSAILGVAFVDGTTKTAYRLTSGTTWTVPENWTNVNNIYMIGAGGGGGGGASSGQARAAGGGGGGGGFTQIINFAATPGQTISYTVGTGTSGANGGSTTWNSGSFIAGGGQRGTATTAPLSLGGAGGTGTVAGGTGGAGAFGTTAGFGYGSGGGGGAGGPNGVGGNGGNGIGASTTGQIAGGGGGGNGGGTTGTNASLGLGGNGGNNSLGTGGGAGSATLGSTGTLGGGGGGSAALNVGGNSGSGIDILQTLGGAGGRGGFGVSGTTAASSGVYGAGAAGGGVNTTGATVSGGAGSQGVIFIVYDLPAAPPAPTTLSIAGGWNIQGSWAIA